MSQTVPGPAVPRAVLVTGAHRSGTTVLGEILGLGGGSAQVWEPFNPQGGLLAVRGAYPYLPGDGAAAPETRALVAYLTRGVGAWHAKAGSRRIPLPVHNAIRTTRRRVDWYRGVRSAPTVLVKDPFQLLALGSFTRHVSATPAVVAIRHPAAWVHSLRRVGWPAGNEAQALLTQPAVRELVAPVLSAEHLAVRDWHDVDPLLAGAVAWTCLYHAVDVQRAAGAAMEVVAMEDFSTRPVPVLQRVFARTGVRAPADLDAVAAEYTEASTVSPAAGVVFEQRRDSARLSVAWRTGMSAEDQDRIRAVTEPVYHRWYADWDDPAATA